MPRLIDADKLRKDVLDLPNCYNGFSDTYDKAMIIDLIDEQPTVGQPQINATENMVEIVRCKDCIYYHKGDWYDDDVCKVHSNDDRGYCAWGERK